MLHPAPSSQLPIFTVTELTSQIRSVLEHQFPRLCVAGEISNLRKPSSGHLYFTLKDQGSQIRTVFFRGMAQHLRFALQDGLEVIVHGQLTVYEPRGDYQLILDSLEPKGIGALQLAFDQLREKLSQEGLFDPGRKRVLPFFPRRIGVITSPTGAAIRDILTVLHRRCPIVEILIHPVPVQGEGAASEIAKAIETLNAIGNLEVLIVGRGGGSLEDLWCFNEEIVVRAIAGSSIPIISAIGHEIDSTLSDYAADYRAPTPSAAAEIAVRKLEDFFTQFREYTRRLTQALRQTITLLRSRAQNCSRALPDPFWWLTRYMQRLDELESRLSLAFRERHEKTKVLFMALQSRIHTTNLQFLLNRDQALVPQLLARTVQGILAALKEHRHSLAVQLSSLNNLSPLAILSRGYGIVETFPGKRVVRRARDVSVGDSVKARVAEGELICVVQKTKSP